MDAIAPWLTPALLVALFTWLRLDIREMRRDLNDRIDKSEKRMAEGIEKAEKRTDDLADEMNKRFDQVNKRFDQVNRELADLRERMAKLQVRSTASSPDAAIATLRPEHGSDPDQRLAAPAPFDTAWPAAIQWFGSDYLDFGRPSRGAPGEPSVAGSRSLCRRTGWRPGNERLRRMRVAPGARRRLECHAWNASCWIAMDTSEEDME